MSNRILFAPLGLIRSALCPLEFRARKVSSVPELHNIVRAIPAFGELEVGDCLRYESVFPYSDHNKHRKLGCQLVTAPFGLAPEDIEALFGIYSYASQLEKSEGLPPDLTLTMTINQIARQAGLPNTGPKDSRRIQSRIFRLSYMKLTNTAVWNTAERNHRSLENFGLFDIQHLSPLVEPWQPVTLQFSRAFATLIRTHPRVAFDLEAVRSLKSPAKRRFFSIVTREGWNQGDSQVYDADAFAIHQIGFARHDDEKRETSRRRRRLHDLRLLIKEFEQRDLIRPYKPWHGYFATPTRGPLAGKLCVRWSRGPAVRSKNKHRSSTSLTIEADPLFDQVKTLKDQAGLPLSVPAYRSLLKENGRDRLQQHVHVILAQKRCQPGSFQRSEVAAFVDRVKKDHPNPSWYTPELARPRIDFSDIAASPEVQKLYDAISITT